MIPKECKRLAEVDFPIAEVSKHAAREKSIRHGHPSTLHLWWARRPLASCRAMLMALLLPDPCDEHCPEDFKAAATNILLSKPNRPAGWTKDVVTPEGLRKVLLKFIGDFANWDNSADKDYLETARALIKAAHPEETPLVVDPFAGGGSIPLEALRLGCETFASDLNPVACLILKVMLEDIPRWGRKKVKVKKQNGEEVEAGGLAEALRIVGKDVKEAAENELAEYYPKDPDGAIPIAYLWARTVKCESPNCGAEIPLMRSFWLCKNVTRYRAIRYKVVRSDSAAPKIEFEIFKPTDRKEVLQGTMTNGRGKCLCCGAVLPPDRVREQLSNQHGGADVSFNTNYKRSGGAKILAVVTRKSGNAGTNYRLSEERDYKAVWNATRRLKELYSVKFASGLNLVPDEPINPIRPSPNARGLSAVTRCGMRTFGDLFTARQKLSLLTLALQVQKLEPNHISDLFGAVISRCADYSSSGVVWAQGGEFVAHTFGRQALPIVWDFAETVLWADASGSMSGAVDWVARVVEAWQGNGIYGQVNIADASESPLPDDSSTVWFTDPPYYDAIPYADLSDYFLVWLKRAFPHNRLLQDPFNRENPLSPKLRECVWNMSYEVNGKFKDGRFFEKTIARSFREGYRVLREDGVGCVVFAHKSTEGWEALLSGMIRAGWVITCSWPIATERVARLRARESASLATSVHLVCRPRPEDAPIGDWAEVLRELPNRVGNWMERLQKEHIRGADLVFACIGPALEIFSRYSKVVDPQEREIPLGGDPEAVEPHKRGFLAYVWETVGRMALEQVLGTEEAQARNGAAGALEEDARLTALFLWTLQSTNGNGESKRQKEKGKSEEIEENEHGVDEGEEEDAPKGKVKGYSLVFDVARRFAQPLGIDLPKWENRIIKTEKGVVRLLPVSERAKQLFEEEGAKAAVDWIEQDPVKSLQIKLFPELEEVKSKKVKGKKGKGIINIADTKTKAGNFLTSDFSLLPSREREATTLDRVHAAMLLQAGGQTNALRSLIKAEQDRSPDFLRLANALSALYPKGSEEKRLLDAMLLAVPR